MFYRKKNSVDPRIDNMLIQVDSFYNLKNWNYLFETFPIPHLVDIQRISFQNLVKYGLGETIGKKNPLVFSKLNKNKEEKNEIVFFPSLIQYGKPKYNPNQALRHGKTYESSVYIPLVIKTPSDQQETIEWILLGFLPLMTKHGHFIINGISRVVLHQMTRNPGIYSIAKDSQTRVPTIRIIPEQGSWLSLTSDRKNRIWVTTRILKKKVSILVFLQALGLSLNEIFARLNYSEKLKTSIIPNLKIKQQTSNDIILQRAGLQGHPLTQEEAWNFLYAHYQESRLPENEEKEEILTAAEFFWSRIWNKQNCQLGLSGRQQFNKKLKSTAALTEIYLTPDDMLLATQALLDFIVGNRVSDDIDSLTNKSIYGCGEFLRDEVVEGLNEFDFLLKQKFTTSATKPKFNFLNFWTFYRQNLSKIISKHWKKFFTSGTLSQFMDETNPLAELTHKRRLTFLGPGGVSSEQATIDIRGIHPTYYGRLCPIETPEGKNAGLVNSFTVYSQSTSQGNIETPFYTVFKGQVQKFIKPYYIIPQQETFYRTAPADLLLDPWNSLPKTNVPIRKQWKFEYDSWNQISYQSVNCLQLISIATSLIPFLEHDDANRALMASNMQRQAVPVIKPEVAVVETGLESRVISDVNHSIQASQTGYITSVTAKSIHFYTPTKYYFPISKLKLYFLKKTKVLETINNNFSKLSIIYLILQLGYFSKYSKFPFLDNLLKKIAKKPISLFQVESRNYSNIKFNSLNFLNYLRNRIYFNFSPKPQINLFKNSSSLLKSEISYLEDKYYPDIKNKISGSIKFNNLKIYQRTNKSTLNSQRPNVGERDWVQKADILADGAASSNGKVAIGKNVLVAYLPWEGYNYEDAILISERLVKEDIYTSFHLDYYEIEITNTQNGLELITNQLPIGKSEPDKDFLRIRKLNSKGLIRIGSWVEEGDFLVGKVSPLGQQGYSLARQYEKFYNFIIGHKETNLRNTSLRVPKGVEGFVLAVKVLPPQDPEILYLAPKSITRVRVTLLHQRKIQVGDKMAGRHGNKGIISKIIPIQDMPYLPDGTSIDIVLNPLGVPSRMNVGQILEALLGLAGNYLNESYTLALFDEKFGAEASRSFVYSKLYEASLKTYNPWLFEPCHPGKMKLYDGRTGQPFDQPITVGYSYMLKLVHLVDEKIHARSTGPYSAITQQPVRGRSRNGGQRLGEMEVWALQAYGAAFTLQELLTIKSDDIKSRTESVYNIYTRKTVYCGQPESFKVLLRELQALCFNVKLYNNKNSISQIS